MAASTTTRARTGRNAANRARSGDDAALRRLLGALTAVRDGNFRKRLPVAGDDLLSEIALVFNEVAERNQHLAGELARVRRVVGREGHLTERLAPSPGDGAWAANVEAANALLDDLVRPTTEAARVLAGVAEGDLSQHMELRIDGQALRGEFLRMAKTVNGLVDQLSSFSSEVIRVAQEVGTEGKLGGQAKVRGVSGSWKDLTDSVNSMAGQLTAQVRDIALVTTAVAKGDLSRKVTVEVAGEMLELKNTVNTMVDQLSSFASEVTRVAREVGTEGILGGQAAVSGVSGTWRDLTDSVNVMASNLTSQVRDISSVATAVAGGDLSKQITVSARGEIAQLADTINSMTGTLWTFAVEVTRVAREIGTEGRLGGQAQVPGVAGTWKDLTDSVNFMAGNLTSQVRDISSVASAVARGDLSRTITVEVAGEMLALKDTLNTMVDQLSSFASEVTRVAREVGSEGQLGGQAQVPGVAGTWKDLTDSVNLMASNLTGQVRNIAQVATAVAQGDLSQKITVDVRGELLNLKDTLNTMVDQLSSFASEVTRVAREVGSEGRLGGQAEVPGVGGTWRDLTDSVNFMAGNLTSQVRGIAQVTTAVASGDLSQKITVDARGELLELKSTINTMVDQLSSFASEVTRVAREVGTEGRLGGQAQVFGVAGTWRDLTDSVNFMAGNLTTQVRNIAEVATAVARGDLSRKITVEAKGEILELKSTVNTMVDQLSAFADEVTRVAREVGTDGRLGGQADVEGISGTWKDLTESVNVMANNLTGQVRNIAQVTTAVASGDLSQKITVDARGEFQELKNTINTMVDQLSSFADEVTRVARSVGNEGILGGQAMVRGVSGIWKDLTDNFNLMAFNLTSQVRAISMVASAVVDGDLSKTIDIEAKGEIANLAGTINQMVETLSSFAAEVTRVAREVGTEGILGGQAHVPNVAGTWKNLTDNVNSMANNLTNQVRNIALVITAVANGDLTKHMDVDARGEILALKTTINTTVDQLSAFASEVTRVAREVGVEGRLGGQAEVEGVSGTWKRLTENVNELAGNLTAQVRAITEVATAVTRGELDQQVTVDALGEVAQLKDNVNLMIGSLRETTIANEQQDWLKTNLARISGLMQFRRDLQALGVLIMSELTPVVSAQHGAFFLAHRLDEAANEATELELIAGYGFKDEKVPHTTYRLGETLIGQAAVEKKPILVESAPPDYIRISSGLGAANPVNVLVMPILFEDQVLGVIELASFTPFKQVHRDFLEQLMETIGVTVNAIIANSRTEVLLSESQRLAQVLQAQQEELRRSNAELEEKAALLATQNRDIEIKNSEIEHARQELEERARQLATSSEYKSEFLANMSHELRTPLNSLLILAKLLADNPDRNLTAKQVEFAETIHSAGGDLLQMINDILDVSKIEAGKMDVRPGRVALAELLDYVEATFRPLTAEKGLEFTIQVAPTVPATLLTDEQRLQQVLRNLLSNAVKFTESGSVELDIDLADGMLAGDGESADRQVLAFSVHDTGIGIASDKLQVIFDAFQQADGTTSRKYGGTGLGLSISRNIARLLGGEIHARSQLGRGSVFTLYLPVEGVGGGEDFSAAAMFGTSRLGQRSTAPAPAVEPPHDALALEARPDEDQPAPAASAPTRAGEGGDTTWVAEYEPPGLANLGGSELAGPDLVGWGGAPETATSTPEPTGGVGPVRVVVLENADSGRLASATERALTHLAGERDSELAIAHTAEQAMAEISVGPVDCVVVDLDLPAGGAAAFLGALATAELPPGTPVLAHAGRSLSRREQERLRGLPEALTVVEVPTVDLLREELASKLFGGERETAVSDEMATTGRRLEPFAGEKVLIVDDDVRNVFALTSVLEQHRLSVLYAENGREGIEVLERNEDIALVLMDIMMPEMDGYATMAAIRDMPQFAGLPIIALTAKAMKGDREKSLTAGASDYITKPVDVSRLLHMIHQWLAND